MEMKIIDERELFDRNFKIYGTVDEPLFLAKNIADLIEYSEGNVSHMCSMVDESEIRKIFCSILSTKPMESMGEANRLFLTEDGVYEVLFRSDKPIAKTFKKQVKAILKEIRKNGGYIATNESESDEDIIARALILAQRTIDRKDKMIKSLENEIVESQPMIAIAEAVTESEDNWDMGLFAKVLGVMGKNNLFKYLRENKIFMDNNEPYATHIKYFKVVPMIFRNLKKDEKHSVLKDLYIITPLEYSVSGIKAIKKFYLKLSNILGKIFSTIFNRYKYFFTFKKEKV
jgi:prophage antirepressor-like protein